MSDEEVSEAWHPPSGIDLDSIGVSTGGCEHGRWKKDCSVCTDEGPPCESELELDTYGIMLKPPGGTRDG